MKLIVVGATGFVGTECTIQALSNPEIKSVVALTRRPLELGVDVDTSKLTNVVIEDFGHYSDDAKKQLAEADACIWTVAITPTKSKGMDPDVVRRICYAHTFSGLDVIMQGRGSGKSTPLRWMYVSGVAIVRDPTKIPDMVPEAMRPMVLLRGQVENDLVAYATKHPNDIELSCARPGHISSPEKPLPPHLQGFPQVSVKQIAACMIDQVLHGFEKDPLMNDDLVRIGQQVLEGRANA